MDTMNDITLFQNLVYVSYAVMALGLGLAIFFFFYFKIPDVFMMMTGRAKKETVQRIAEENFKTGKLRMGPITGSTKQSGKLKKTGRTGSLAAVHISDTGPVTNTPAAVEQATETSVLDQVAETSVLDQVAETSVLDQVAETSVLAQSNTSVPEVEAAAVPVPEQTSAETSVLVRQQPSIRFDVTESTIVIHTDEKVS